MDNEDDDFGSINNEDDNTGLANHLIRWRRGNVWDYYVLESRIGEGSIGSINLVKRRKGTEGGSAYTHHHRTTSNEKEGTKDGDGSGKDDCKTRRGGRHRGN